MTRPKQQPSADGSRRGRPPPGERDPFGSVLPDQTRDEDGSGWGEREYDADEDLRREVPPHHG